MGAPQRWGLGAPSSLLGGRDGGIERGGEPAWAWGASHEFGTTVAGIGGATASVLRRKLICYASVEYCHYHCLIELKNSLAMFSGGSN